MPSPELQRLWKLHQIDSAIAELRNRAAHLDVGRVIQAEIDAITKEEAVVGGEARRLSAELTDLELANKGIDDKIKKIDRELYGGKVVNPREVQNLEREIEILKRQRSGNDEKILELWELAPPAKEQAAKVQERLEAAKLKLGQRQNEALREKKNLEAEFARLNQSRPDAGKGISPSLLARYEDIRKRHGGIGMAQITKQQTCGGCGTHMPERTLAALKDDKVATCESCHRILYLTDGLV